MKEIKFKDKSNSYSVVIGNNIITFFRFKKRPNIPVTKSIAATVR